MICFFLQYQHTNSLNADGSRKKIYPGDVTGRFHKLKNFIYPSLMAAFFLLPWIKIQDHRLFLLDIIHRRFFIFGLSFNAQDIYLVFFLLTGVGFTLFHHCTFWANFLRGWLCPQTVLGRYFSEKSNDGLVDPDPIFLKNKIKN